MQHVYDMIVIGGGPAGYTAALYGARSGLDTLVIEKMTAGGQMALTTQIDNYPGFPEGTDGYTLGMSMRSGAERFGAKTVSATVTAVELQGSPKVIYTDSGTYYSRTAVIATGAFPRQLGVPGEKELVGMGVSYCAHCDGMLYRRKTVVVVGGGNSAVADALLLSRVAKQVILVHRRDSLRATRLYNRQLENTENLQLRYNTVVRQLLSAGVLTGVELEDVRTGEKTVVSCDGLFVSIGREPATELFAGQLELDEDGYIRSDETTRTNLEGVFAAGDVRAKPLRQIVTAVADGAVAAQQAEHCLTSAPEEGSV